MSKKEQESGKAVAKRASLTEAEKAQRAIERTNSFRRLAVKRVNKVVKMLNGIGNLSSYKPSMEQAALIERALVDAHNDAIGRLKGTSKTAGTFNL